MSNKSRKSNRLRKGGNGPLYPDTMPHVFGNLEDEIKKQMLDIKKTALSIIKTRAEAELSSQTSEAPRTNTADVNSLPLDSPVPDLTNDLTNYDPHPFWGNLFTTDDLNKIIEILKTDDVCNKIKGIVPAFEINAEELPEPEKRADGVKVYNINNTTHFIQDDNQLAELKAKYNAHLPEKRKIMCAALMILGIISSKMQTTNQEYDVVAKGGVAVSFALTKLTGGNTRVPVNDLDFKLISAANATKPKGQSNQLFILAKHIGGLVAWLLKKVIGEGYSISILEPSTKPHQQGYMDIIKLSVRRPDGIFIPVLDLDFGNNATEINYFNKTFRIDPKPDNMPVSFIYQSDRQMLAEKLYYYAQYFDIKSELENNYGMGMLKANSNVAATVTPFGRITCEPSSNVVKHDGKPIEVVTCDRFIKKFKKSIMQLTDAIIRSSPESSNKSKPFLKTLERVLLIELIKDLVNKKQFPEIHIGLIALIVDSIYPRSQDTFL